MTSPADQTEFLTQLNQHKNILYKVANTYCDHREDRGDLIQEIIIQLWRSFERFDKASRFSTWMHRVAMNTAISFYRGESCRVRDTVSIDESAPDLTEADKLMDSVSDDLRSLHQLIGLLDAINRAIIVLYLEGYGHDEIADIVGISPTNVATRINRIKQKLQQYYRAT